MEGSIGEQKSNEVFGTVLAKIWKNSGYDEKKIQDIISKESDIWEQQELAYYMGKAIKDKRYEYDKEEFKFLRSGLSYDFVDNYLMAGFGGADLGDKTLIEGDSSRPDDDYEFDDDDAWINENWYA